jgi:hypothetical protein
MKRVVSAVVGLLLLGALSVPVVTGGSAGVAFTDFANIFTSNQRINAGLGINVAPGATGTVSTSGALFERSRSTAMGEWTSVAYSAGNFTTPGGVMTWTVDSGDQITYAYALVGKTMFLAVYLDTTSITCTCSPTVSIAIPGGFTAAKKIQSAALMFDNGVARAAYNRVAAAGTTVEVGIDGSTNFTASTNNTYIRVFIMFEVQ